MEEGSRSSGPLEAGRTSRDAANNAPLGEGSLVNICACMGPAGDCPCIRQARGEKVEITETHIAPELFALLSDDDKNTINSLKVKALGHYMQITRRGPP